MAITALRFEPFLVTNLLESSSKTQNFPGAAQPWWAAPGGRYGRFLTVSVVSLASCWSNAQNPNVLCGVHLILGSTSAPRLALPLGLQGRGRRGALPPLGVAASSPSRSRPHAQPPGGVGARSRRPIALRRELTVTLTAHRRSLFIVFAVVE